MLKALVPVRQTQCVRQHEREQEGQHAIDDEVDGIRTPSRRRERLSLKQTHYLLPDDRPINDEGETAPMPSPSFKSSTTPQRCAGARNISE